ncbi:MAG: ABC transporter permease [Actinomycetia bacterium]|nr:ABC transporter permease [Actinomycetes bacterium]
MVSGIMASAISFISDREKGIYHRFSLTLLKKSTLLGAQIIQKYLVMIVQTILLLIVGVFMFEAQIKGNFFLFWLLFTPGSFCFLSIGFFLASFIKSSKAATPACMIVFFMLMFLRGLFFPASIMPDFLVAFSNFLPSTHLKDALRITMVEGQGISRVVKEIAVVSAWLVVTLGLSVKFFKWE